jgi:hypothetical protein
MPVLAQPGPSSPPAASPGSAPSGRSASLGARIDCLHDFSRDKGASQDCLTLTGLRIGFEHQENANLVARIRLDPFATPIGGRETTPRRDGLPGPDDTGLGIIDDYAMVWIPRPNLEIAAQSYDGAAQIRSVSGLALANSFALTGWKQSALTVTYNLPALTDMRVRFAVGNGEGEDGENLDPQQYFGFEASAGLVKGLKLSLGVSLDGNSAGSSETAFLASRIAATCGISAAAGGADAKLGHSTQRLAAAAVIDGTMPGIEGLKAGIGWQRNVLSDLDKKQRSRPAAEDVQGAAGCPIDPDSFFVEVSDDSAVNTVQKTTLDVSLGYQFMGSYFVGVDYTTRHIDTGSVDAFQLCDAFVGGVCTTPGTASNKLGQDAVTFGAGMQLADGLTLTLEYHETQFDGKYAAAFYAAPDDKTSDSLEIFNARLAYLWR